MTLVLETIEQGTVTRGVDEIGRGEIQQRLVQPLRVPKS